MPHIVIEYSDNLSTDVKNNSLDKQLFDVVVDSGLFSPEAVKARSIGYQDYILPQGAENFIHITISILAGRTLEQKATLSNSVFDTAKKAISNCDKLSVDIHDMDAASYKK